MTDLSDIGTDPGPVGIHPSGEGGAPPPDTAQGPQPGDGAPSAEDLTCRVCEGLGHSFVAKSAGGLRRHTTITHGRQAPGDSGPGLGEVAGSGAPGDMAEQAPGMPPKRRRGFRELIRGRTKAEGAAARPRRSWALKGPREPLDEITTWAYGGVGSMIVRGGTDMVPVGRVMEMQAPSIGVMFDEAFKGTMADRILQPLVRQGKAFRQVGEAVGLPVMTGLIVKRPQLLGVRRVIGPDGVEVIIADGPLFQPYYALWEGCAVEMAKGFERKEQKRREIAKELESIPFLAPIIAAGEDPIMWLMLETLGRPQDNLEPAQPAPPQAGPPPALVPDPHVL